MSSTVQDAPDVGSALSVLDAVTALNSALDAAVSMQWWQAHDSEVTGARQSLWAGLSRARRHC